MNQSTKASASGRGALARAEDSPVRGAGIGLRRRHFSEILEHERPLDFLEIIPENYVGKGGRYLHMLDACAERWPILAHGVSMSIGGPDPLDHEYLAALRQLLDRIGAPFYTDHLCFATLGGRTTFDLLPLPFNEEAVRHTAARVRELADALDRPIALENISYYAQMPTSDLDEGAFVSAVIQEADCMLLLDVNNVFVNARNHELNPSELLWQLPVDRACQIHLAGHKLEGPRLLDNHGAPVCEEVWALYREVIERCGPIPTLIEWDTQIPELAAVLDQADLARVILDEGQP
ncbi:hypothetical protein DB30_08071 [Enhygromyxa salina]|uniref:Uncharacterized protein n=1 Tax=Enhygromyxa salina TaxID=215803 RepID=A0A0C1Z728_9BACT|nr:DUF692 domain-containing protein [Enhygromyxa salina]KIG13444.1 hypothetical protein DB30_08071 [Enhygromyxa salina]